MITRHQARLEAKIHRKSTQRARSKISNKTKAATTETAKYKLKRRNNSQEKNETRGAAPSDPLLPKRKRKTNQITHISAAIIKGRVINSDDKSSPPSEKYPADVNETNITLVAGETNNLMLSKGVEEVSPSQLSNIGNTIANVLEEANAHLIKIEPRLKICIDQNYCHILSPEGLDEEIDAFQSLVRSIISQQVSGAAAKSIKTKFIALFNLDKPDPSIHVFPTPIEVCSKSLDTLRTGGLSQRKAEYIKGLAEKFVSGELTTSLLVSATYEQLREALIKVRGLGQWSVEMFAFFELKRLDVFSTGDLGVQRGMAAFMGRDVEKLKAKGGKWKYMSESEMLEIAEKFRPYRSLFMWYMWQWEQTDVGALMN
ncbi:hypothetical protein B7463_g10890, partial [Scytalidium lignicola]